MLLRPPFVIGIVILFSALCGYLLMNGIRQGNEMSSTLALLAIGCLIYLVYLYQQLLITPPDEMDKMADQ